MPLILDGNGDITGLVAGALPANVIGAGGVLQVVQATKTDTFSTISTSFTDITGLSISITPTSATSKILVMYSINTAQSNTAEANRFTLVRGSTQIFIGNGSSQTSPSTSYASNYNLTNSPMGTFQYNLNAQYLDSPATTSSTTYKIQMQVSAGTGYVNRRADGNFDGTVSSITVMEIAA